MLICQTIPSWKNNVIGLLLVKDLIFVDPEDETLLLHFIRIFGRSLAFVSPDDKLGDVLSELRSGRSHMALVRKFEKTEQSHGTCYEIQGVITLEDIVEQILGQEIVDETDTFVDRKRSQPVNLPEPFEWASLRLLD